MSRWPAGPSSPWTASTPTPGTKRRPVGSALHPAATVLSGEPRLHRGCTPAGVPRFHCGFRGTCEHSGERYRSVARRGDAALNTVVETNETAELLLRAYETRVAVEPISAGAVALTMDDAAGSPPSSWRCRSRTRPSLPASDATGSLPVSPGLLVARSVDPGQASSRHSPAGQQRPTPHRECPDRSVGVAADRTAFRRPLGQSARAEDASSSPAHDESLPGPTLALRRVPQPRSPTPLTPEQRPSRPAAP